VQSAADFDDDVGAAGEVSAKALGKRVFPGRCVGAGREPASPGAAGSTLDQKRLKPCWGRPLGLHGELESESKTEIPARMS
jgi:hypothetical protein